MITMFMNTLKIFVPVDAAHRFLFLLYFSFDEIGELLSSSLTQMKHMVR